MNDPHATAAPPPPREATQEPTGAPGAPPPDSANDTSVNGPQNGAQRSVARPTASEITDDQLDQLYTRLDRLQARLDHVRGRCPACGHESLLLGGGGYITCRRAHCPDPAATDALLGDALHTERDRYRLAWLSARDRADAQGYATRWAHREANALHREIDRLRAVEAAGEPVTCPNCAKEAS